MTILMIRMSPYMKNVNADKNSKAGNKVKGTDKIDEGRIRELSC